MDETSNNTLHDSNFCDTLFNNQLTNKVSCKNVLSNIDKTAEAFLAKRHKFPSHDPLHIRKFSDNRSPVEKFSDIINICNQKVSSNLLPEWEKLCGRSIVDPCYYRSGLNYGKNLLQKAQKEFKLNNTKIDVNADVTMPVSLKCKPQSHSDLCRPENNICVYLSEKLRSQDQLHDLFQDKTQLLNKLECKKLCKYLINCTVEYLKKWISPKFKTKLSRFSKILNKGCTLKYSYKKKLTEMCKKIFKLDEMKNQNSAVKHVYLSDVSKMKLPFSKGILLPKHHKNISKILNLPIKKLLLDSGSDTNICSLTEVKSLGFSEKDINPCGRFTLNGSTGQITDCFLGTVFITIHLQNREGTFYKQKVLFYVASPEINLNQIILGQPFLNLTKAKIEYKTDCIQVKCNLLDINEQIKRSNLQLVSSTGKAQLENEDQIPIGSAYSVFSLKIEDNYDFYSQCKVENKYIDFPLLNFDSIMTACYFQGKMIQEHQENLKFIIPFNTETKTLIEPKCKSQVINCNFVDAEMSTKLFSASPDLNSCISKQGHLSGGDGAIPGHLSATAKHLPSGSPAQASAQVNVPAKCLSESGPTDQGHLGDSFEEKILRNSLAPRNSYTTNIFHEDLIKDNNFECITFLPEDDQCCQSFYGEETLEQKVNFSDIVDQNTVGRISLEKEDNKFGLQKNQISHLNRDDQQKIQALILKYDDFWATKSSSIGHFKGFKARLELIDDEPCYQKERRMNLSHIEGIEKCIDELTEEGVFALSKSDHNKYAANINVVPKEQNQIRASKADKYISKQENKNQGPTGFRATFDFTTLNKNLKEVGKLSLPPISEIQTKTRDCIASVIDLKNMFFSILLEEDSKSKTNFYWRNRIYCHERLGQGLSVSPYISAAAMNYTFSDAILQRFKNEFGYHDLPFSSFKQYLDFYIDDIIIFNKRNIVHDKYSPTMLHHILLESVIFALNDAGWKGSLPKCNFLKPSFQFLGVEINTKTNNTKLLSDRVQSIQEWRSPMSAGEAGSRLSVLGYFSKHIPFLRLLALPIYNAISAPTFEWTQECEMAFSNLKFVVSLEVELNHYDPDQILITTSDSSAVSTNASFFNFNKDTGQLSLIDTQTKLFAGPELRYTPVQKENMGLMFSLFKGESYIRSNKVETWSLCDASSLQYIQRSKQYNSKQYNQSIYMSSLPRLQIYYVSGKSLLLSDIMSRQFQDIYLKNNNELSEQISKLIPPLQNLDIKNLTKLSSEHLTDYLLRFPRQEVIDVYPKKYKYHQDVHRTQLHNAEQNVSSEWQLFAGLHLGWNNTAILSLPVWQDIVKSKGDVTKSLATQIMKTHNLNKIHQKIVDTNFKENVIEDLLDRFHSIKNKNEKSCNVSISDSFGVSKDKIICSCNECRILLKTINFSKESFKYLCDQSEIISNFIESSMAMLKFSVPEEIQTFNQKIEKIGL